MTVAYLPRNTRPAVVSVTVHPPGVVFQRPFSSEDGAIAGLDDAMADARRPPGDLGRQPAAARPPHVPEGPADDRLEGRGRGRRSLTYTLQYRREGDRRGATCGPGCSDAIFVWDTTLGRRRPLRRCACAASDSPSNSADRALTGERESDPVDVDNTPPAVTVESCAQGGSRRGSSCACATRGARFRSSSTRSAGAPWQVVYPADGLADSPEERYEIPLADEADAARWSCARPTACRTSLQRR